MTIRARQITKSFNNPPTTVLHDVSLEIADGEFVSIMGRSGSGKTTLLYILSTLDQPSTGELEIDGVNPVHLDEESLHRFRNEKIGYVFQFHYLLPELTALENILLPARKAGRQKEKESYAQELLRTFGLDGKGHRFPGQISGGEQQRVAIARALIMNPKYIFADEPTGNLDTNNGLQVMELLQRINKEQGATLILVTHEPDFGAMASRQLIMTDGRLG